MAVRVMAVAVAVAAAFTVPGGMSEGERMKFLKDQEGSLRGAVFYKDDALGFSVVLTKPVKKGACVVTLDPSKALTGFDPYPLSAYLTDFLDEEKLSIRVSYERLMPRDPSNYKREYVHSLPSEFDLPLYWSEEDFQLFENHTIEKYQREFLRVYDVDDLHERVVKALGSVRDLPQGMLEKEAIRYGLAATMSRAFGSSSASMLQVLQSPPSLEEVHMMLPLMDIVNHFPIPFPEREEVNAVFQIFTQQSPVICYRAQFRQKAGAHFFGSYGNDPNYKLVDRYSFAMEKNPDDELFFYLPFADYCTGMKMQEYCIYSTPAYMLSSEALAHLMKQVANVSPRGDLSFDGIVRTLSSQGNPAKQQKMMYALRTYRSHLLLQVTTPLRTLRRLRQTCDTSRCRLILTFCAAQRVARYLHTQQLDRRLLKSLSAGIF